MVALSAANPRKLLTHHPVQSKLLQKLGVDLVPHLNSLCIVLHPRGSLMCLVSTAAFQGQHFGDAFCGCSRPWLCDLCCTSTFYAPVASFGQRGLFANLLIQRPQLRQESIAELSARLGLSTRDSLSDKCAPRQIRCRPLASDDQLAGRQCSPLCATCYRYHGTGWS